MKILKEDWTFLEILVMTVFLSCGVATILAAMAVLVMIVRSFHLDILY
jgi:hypothetical protein